MKKTKGPPNIPTKNDRCKPRGKNPKNLFGEVVKVSNENDNWCTVKWDGIEKKMICHLFELEKID